MDPINDQEQTNQPIAPLQVEQKTPASHSRSITIIIFVVVLLILAGIVMAMKGKKVPEVNTLQSRSATTTQSLPVVQTEKNLNLAGSTTTSASNDQAEIKNVKEALAKQYVTFISGSPTEIRNYLTKVLTATNEKEGLSQLQETNDADVKAMVASVFSGYNTIDTFKKALETASFTKIDENTYTVVIGEKGDELSTQVTKINGVWY